MTATQQPATFQDLCAAGAPLAAIARCLHSSMSCKDQLSLAQAVGKQYRDLVCHEIVHLPAVTMASAGRPWADFMAAANLTRRLVNVRSVSMQYTYPGHIPCDLHGLLSLLRLLPCLEELWVSVPSLAVHTPGVCHSLAALTTLKHLTTYGAGCARCVAQLTQLSFLAMSGFPLDAEAVELLAGLKGLQGLNISCCNDLSGVNLSPFTNLTNLQARTHLHHEAVHHMCTLTALRELDLERCSLDPGDIQKLGALVELTHLCLAETQMCVRDDDSISSLSRLTKLEVLDVSGCELTEATASLTLLSVLSSLRQLDCSYNNLTDKGALHIGKCTWLRQLNIEENCLGNLGVACLSGLVGLESLYIGNNGICSDIVHHTAQGLPRSTSWSSDDDEVEVAGVLAIACMKQLRELEIHGNELDKHSVQVLHAALPNLSATCRAALIDLTLQDAQN